jgi:tRNA-dihydrouridine synthase B
VVANGDITSPETAREVLQATGADAIMVGRAAQGRPWIFREIAHFLATGTHLAPPLISEIKGLLIAHLHDHYSLYGEFIGVRSARKHIGWYVRDLPGGEDFRAAMNLLEEPAAQVDAVTAFFDSINHNTDRIPAQAIAANAKGMDMMELSA